MTLIGVWLTTVLTVALLVVGGLVVSPVSATIQIICKGVSNADVKRCDPGYAAVMNQMHWRMYAGHNCTNYVAYQMGANGVPEPRILMGNARDWVGNAKRLGYTVNTTPAVGSVGAWGLSRNHVTYVAEVGPDYIITHEDNFPGYYPNGIYQVLKIYKGDSSYPALFIHFKDLITGATPTISGTMKVGSTLNAATGAWSPSRLSFAYQWSRDGVAIGSANDDAYALTADDLGHSVTVTVSASKSGFVPLNKTSAMTPAIAPGTLTTTVAPVIDGTQQVGSTLTASGGTWSVPGVSTTVQWLRNGVAIDGATLPSYTLTADDLGSKVSATVSGSKPGYTTLLKSIPQTVAVAPGIITNTTAPTVTGTARMGQTLVAGDGVFAPDGADLTRQWLANGVAIGGATDSTFVPTVDEVGKKLSVKVTATKPGYTTLSKVSAETVPVVGVITSTTPPSITGIAKVGSALTAVAGTWSPAGTSLAYQWFAGDVPIDGATGSTYTPVAGDLNKLFSVKVTATKPGYLPTTAVSPKTSPIAVGAISFSVAPTATGTPRVGEVMTAHDGTWSPSGLTFVYQWFRGTTAIPGATMSTYTLAAADLGKDVSVRVTASKAGYTSLAAHSAAAKVKAGLMTMTVAPSIVGTARVGETLTTDTGTWTPSGLTFTYLWYSNGTALPGSTGRTYILGPSDIGRTISVRVTASKPGFTPSAIRTTSTAAVVPGVFTVSTLPTISGRAVVGTTLTAVTGSWSPAPRFTYLWYRGDTRIASATSSTYTPVASDVGKQLWVRVTGSKSGFVAIGKASAKTIAVRRSSTLTVSPKTAKGSATFAIRVTASGVTPTGVIVIRDGGKILRTITLSGGSANLTLTKLAKGKHRYVFTYSGDPYAGPTAQIVTVAIG